MSYCRKSPGESDVYVYLANGGFVCFDCSLYWPSYRGPLTHTEPSFQAILQHLQLHIDAGHHVPEAALTKLRNGEIS